MRLLWIVLLALTLSSCASIAPTPSATPPAEPKATWAERQTSLNRIQSWWLNGKIAVQTNKDSGSAAVSWTQTQRSYALAITGPLGAGSMKLSGTPSGVTLQASDGKTYSAKSAEQLLATKWGFKLPVSNMRYWMRGLPAPGASASTHFDQNARLTSLDQQGWHIEYMSYTNAGGIDLPEKVSITSPMLRVKIVVYQWRVA